jgi:NTP pyrophosphatase (non-canonical NTP hydrolase)
VDATQREPMNFAEMQHRCREWEQRQPFGRAPWWHRLFGIVEEVGELAHAFLKQEQGIRGTRGEHEENGKDAIGDILIFLANLCSARGWDLQEIVEQTVEKVTRRDWATDPQKGGEYE